MEERMHGQPDNISVSGYYVPTFTSSEEMRNIINGALAYETCSSKGIPATGTNPASSERLLKPNNYKTTIKPQTRWERFKHFIKRFLWKALP